jgi:hypothetical protein
MNDKQQSLIKDFLVCVDQKYHELYLELANFAISLGYTPVRNKTQDLSIDFRKNKTRKTIMKIEEKEQKHDGYHYGERNVPGLRLKFFASKEYSDIFRKGIQRVIEGFDGKYTGCYGCGRCTGNPQGYTYIYPDGRRVFRCGSELISVFDFTPEHIQEMKKLLKEQDEYFSGNIVK